MASIGGAIMENLMVEIQIWKRATERQADINMNLARRKEMNEAKLELEIERLTRLVSGDPKEWELQKLKTQTEIEIKQSKSFKNQIASKDKLINELRQQLSKRESEISSAVLVKKELEAKNSELITLKERLEGQDSPLAEDQAQKFKDQILSKDSLIKSLEQKLSLSSKEVAKLNEKLSAKEKEALSLKEDKVKMAESKKEELKVKQEQIKNLKVEVTSQKKEIKRMGKESEQSVAELEGIKSILQSQSNQAMALEASKSEREAIRLVLRSINEELLDVKLERVKDQEEMVRLKEEIKNSEKEAIRKVLRSLNEELLDVKLERVKDQEEIVRLNEEIKKQEDQSSKKSIATRKASEVKEVVSIESKSELDLGSTDKAKVNPQDQIVEKVNEIVTCGVCFELAYRPFVLSPCGHTFCLGCLISYFKSPTHEFASTTQILPSNQANISATIKRTKKCPSCRETVKVPPTEVWSLKSLVHLVDSVQKNIDLKGKGKERDQGDRSFSSRVGTTKGGKGQIKSDDESKSTGEDLGKGDEIWKDIFDVKSRMSVFSTHG